MTATHYHLDLRTGRWHPVELVRHLHPMDAEVLDGNGALWRVGKTFLLTLAEYNRTQPVRGRVLNHDWVEYIIQDNGDAVASFWPADLAEGSLQQMALGQYDLRMGLDRKAFFEQAILHGLLTRQQCRVIETSEGRLLWRRLVEQAKEKGDKQ